MKSRLRKAVIFLFSLLLFSTILNLTPSLISVNAALTTQLTSIGGASNPDISGDGSKIAFQVYDGEDNEIYVVNSDGTGLTQLTDNTANDREPRISDDGSKVTFESDVDGANGQIYVINSDGTGLTQLTDNTGRDAFPVISGDGSKVTFESDIVAWTGDFEIMVINSDGTGLTQLTDNTANDMRPSINYDGSIIAFNSDADGDDQIYIINSDGTGLSQVTTTNTELVFGIWPSISDDGSKIAFYGMPPGVGYEIFVVNSDGTGLTRLTYNTVTDSEPDISGDGSKVTFESSVPGDQIFVVNSDGTGLTQLPTSTVSDGHPSISGDGSKIAFGGDGEIFLIALETETSTSLSVTPDPQTIGYNLLIAGTISPPPPMGYVFSGITVHVTKPDGSTETLSSLTSNQAGEVSTLYAPDDVGTWRFYLNKPTETLDGTVYLASTSPTVNVYVQDEVPTSSSLSVTPNPTTQYYPLQIEGQVTPAPQPGYFYSGIEVFVEVPGYTATSIGSFTSDAYGQISTGYTPSEVGTYGFYMTTPAQYLDVGYSASTSPTVDVTVWESFPLSVIVDPPAGGTVSKDPDATGYAYDTVVTLTPDANTGYTFSGWSGPGVPGSDDDWVVTVTSPNMEVTASFSEIPYDLTVNISPEGSGFVSVIPDPFGYGQEVLLTAIPYSGWYFDHWSGDLSGSTNPQTLVVDGVKTVTAHFLDVPDLTVTTVGAGSVGVDPAGPYTIGQEVTLTADPAAGWVFDYWDGDLTGTTNPDTIVMDGDKTVTAYFLDTPDLTVYTVGGGSVVAYPEPPYYLDDTVELTAVADLLWAFDHWEGDLIGSDNPDTITMDSDKTVTAYFTAVPQGLTIVCDVFTVDVVVEGEWRYLIRDESETLLVNTTIPSNDFATFSGEPFLSGGVFTVTAVPKFGLLMSIETLPDGGSSATISEEPGVYEVTVDLADGGGVVVNFINDEEPSFAYAPSNELPPGETTYTPPSLTIVPIQAAWNPDKDGDGKIDLVQGKETAVVVNLDDPIIPLDATVDVFIEITDPTGVSLYQNSISVAVDEDTKFACFTPITLDTLGELTISGTYQLIDQAGSPIGNPIPLYGIAYDFVNEEWISVPTPTVVTMRQTSGLSLHYFYLQKSGGQGYTYPDHYVETVTQSNNFITATYPIKEVSANTPVDPAIDDADKLSGSKSIAKDAAAVANEALALGASRGVAVAHAEYFLRHDIGDYAGLSYGPNCKGTIVRDEYWTAASHEIGHTFNLNWKPEKEQYVIYKPYGYETCGTQPADPTVKFWRAGIDLMGAAPYRTLDNSWVDAELTYNRLFRALTDTAADPEIVIVSGIFNSVTGELELPFDWSRLEGSPSQIEPGDYAVKFVDANGDPVADLVYFDAEFGYTASVAVAVGRDRPADEGGLIETTEAPFCFTLVLPENAEEIRIIDTTQPPTPEDPDGKVMGRVERSEIVDLDISTEAYLTDTDYNPVDSFECVITPDKKNGGYKMTATNPGTFVYNLKITNIDSTDTLFTVEAELMPFVLKPLSPGANPVRVNGEPVEYSYNEETGTLTVYDIPIDPGQTKTLTVNIDYGIKSKYPEIQPDPPLDEDSQTAYLAPHFITATVNSFHAYPAAVVGVGKKVTAIGGFLTDTFGQPEGALMVKVMQGSAQIGADTTTADGFYFIEVSPGGPYQVEIVNSLETPVGPKEVLSITKNEFIACDFDHLSPADPVIKGFVTDDSNNGISGVTVELLKKNGKLLATTTTNGGGYYAFSLYQPNKYTVRITLPPGYTATETSKTLWVAQFETAKVNFNLNT